MCVLAIDLQTNFRSFRDWVFNLLQIESRFTFTNKVVYIFAQSHKFDFLFSTTNEVSYILVIWFLGNIDMVFYWVSTSWHLNNGSNNVNHKESSNNVTSDVLLPNKKLSF